MTPVEEILRKVYYKETWTDFAVEKLLEIYPKYNMKGFLLLFVNAVFDNTCTPEEAHEVIEKEYVQRSLFVVIDD